MAQNPAAPVDKLKTLDEPLADTGHITLFLAVERIPGLNKDGDLLAQLDTDLTAPVVAPEKALSPVGGDKLTIGSTSDRWLPVRSAFGIYNFEGSPDKAHGYLEYSTNYLFCYLVSPAAQDVVLSLGSDDAFKIYLNGNLISRKVYRRGAVEDSDQVPLSLKPGRNALLVRVDNYGSSAGWIGRILTRDGQPAAGLSAQIDTRPGLPEVHPDTMPELPAEDESMFGARLTRTMSLLESSGPLRRTPVRILIYGQSITAQKHWERIVRRDLAKRYPYAKIEIENRSIGGHIAPALVFSAINDLYPFYPDLILFQVYEGEFDGTLERIFSNIRRRTTAEILTWTEHLDNFVPSRDAMREDSSAYRRMMAAKYNIELVEVRENWKRFLAMHALDRRDLLADGIHLNYLGEALLGKLVMRHLRVSPNVPSFWADMVRTYEAAKPLVDKDGELTLTGDWRVAGIGGIEGRKPTDSLRLEFVGNRVDIVVPRVDSKGKPGTAKVLIDGKAPSAFPECYASTRARCAFAPNSRPGFRYVTLGPDAVAESWLLKLSNVSTDLKTFDYEFVGAKTGPDGKGSAKVGDTIRSTSGRVSACGGFNLHEIVGFAKACDTVIPDVIEIGWTVSLMGTDTYAPRCDLPTGEIERHTVAQGLTNTRHVMEMIPNGDGPLPIKEIVVYSPPLK